MTSDEQEARSHQSLGLWVVPLSSGRLAIFDHPTRAQESCIVGSWEELMALEPARCDERLFERIARKRAALTPQLNLEGIDL